MLTILVADDERSMQEFLKIMLTREGYEVIVASTAEEAIEMISSRSIDLVISDINMPEASGMAVLKSSMENDSNTPVIMITAYAAADTAVEAMKMGAYDYITKPFNIDEIKIVVAKALERRKDKEELGRLKVEVAKSYGVEGDILGKSEQIANIFRMINKMARSRSTVLITGESGTGKELVAKAIHYLSDRKNKPFLSINCGAIPEQLLESELFGHQKGAFTGAVSDKKGLLEIAEGGAFFLDEIGGAPQSVQVKLLRVLQEREFKRVGGVKDIKVDVRIIAATNQCLEDLIKDGEFREDLFYRLNILPIHLPPLRERKEDIPLLVNRFIQKYSDEMKRKNISISNEAMSLLESYHWKGNVRELENIIERAVVLTTGSLIKPENFPDEVRFYSAQTGKELIDLPDEGVDFEEIVSCVEKDLLFKALRRTGGKKKEAARLVNLSFRSFRYKLAKYGIGAAGKKDVDE